MGPSLRAGAAGEADQAADLIEEVKAFEAGKKAAAEEADKAAAIGQSGFQEAADFGSRSVQATSPGAALSAPRPHL